MKNFGQMVRIYNDTIVITDSNSIQVKVGSEDGKIIHTIGNDYSLIRIKITYRKYKNTIIIAQK